MDKKEFVKATVEGILVALAISYIFYSDLRVMVFLIPVIVKVYRFSIRLAVQKKQRKFEEEFQMALQSLESQLSVGYSMENAMREVLKDMEMMCGKETMIAGEFRYMVRQLYLNIAIEQILGEFAQRTGLDPVENFVTIFSLAKRSGGDGLRIIKSSVKKIIDQQELRREIATVTTAKRLEFKVMTAVPFGVILYMRLVFPGFMQILYGNLFGVCFMTVCLLAYYAAMRIGYRIVEIEV